MVCNCELGEREGAKRGGSTHLHNQIKLGSQTERQWGSRIDKKKTFFMDPDEKFADFNVIREREGGERR